MAGSSEADADVFVLCLGAPSYDFLRSDVLLGERGEARGHIRGID